MIATIAPFSVSLADALTSIVAELFCIGRKIPNVG